METVGLIASGYEWTCPECDTLNKEIEIYNQVTCQNCERTFEVNQEDVNHAFH
ncbi:MAG: hypothetical protein JRI94_00115 [Deltaproteobacteria bacterium]|nr:hypothetical protein [Deltaproteobacteria bacterium]MBW2031986.1 hypothetical protein [Deltaproteobacteria bacterium]